MTTQAVRSASRAEAFPRARRVTERRDFERARGSGRRKSSPGFAVEVVATGERTRLGLAVSRRVGGAVVRNRVKRRVREWFRHSSANLAEGFDLVVIARARAATYSSERVREELSQLVESVSR